MAKSVPKFRTVMLKFGYVLNFRTKIIIFVPKFRTLDYGQAIYKDSDSHASGGISN